jgi:hypothetical protein
MEDYEGKKEAKVIRIIAVGQQRMIANCLAVRSITCSVSS